MTIPLSVLIVASGFWIILFCGCGLFIILAQRLRKLHTSELQTTATLKSRLAELEVSLSQLQMRSTEDSEQSVEESENIELLKRKLALLESELAKAEKHSAGKEDDTLVSRLRLDKVNEKYQNIQSQWESTNQELIRSNAKVAELLGAKAALEQERNMLERQLSSLSTAPDESDVSTMREVIINFTEESRELLLEIEKLSTEKAVLEQQVADMEEGGKGTAGKVIGLQRKLDEAEDELQVLKSSR